MPLFGSVAEYLQRVFGGLTVQKETLVTVGTGITQVVERDPERVFIAVVNNGADAVYIAFTESGHAAGRGFRLSANGGAISFSVVEDAHMPSLAMFGISASAGNSVYVLIGKRELVIDEGKN